MKSAFIATYKSNTIIKQFGTSKLLFYAHFNVKGDNANALKTN